MSDLSVTMAWRSNADDLTEAELDFVLQAQRALIAERRGVFGLTSDLKFGFALLCQRPIGVLAFRRDDEQEIWVQIAYVDPAFRRRGVCPTMLQALARAYPTNRIGLGVRASNTPMLRVAEQCGFRAQVAYLFRDSMCSQ